jgi:hypothetical protein
LVTIRISIDPLFPPPDSTKKSNSMGDMLQDIKFELIYDEKIDGPELELLNIQDSTPFHSSF